MRDGSLLDLEVVIVSHGAEALLRRCLASLRAHPPRTATMRVTVVDSGSTDGTPDMVEREFPELRLERRANIGFSAANNLVLRREPRGRGPPAEPRHRGLRRHPRHLPRAARRRPGDRHGRGEAGARGRRARPRLQALLPDPAGGARPLHRDRPRRRARAPRSPSTGRRTWATTSPARSTRSTAPSCSAAPRRSPRSACSTRATGSTWRTSTGATASGTRAGRSSTNPGPWHST